jgi:predicted transglutaminase-like cysteine proteinase
MAERRMAKFGALRHPRLKLKKAIPVRVEVIVSSGELEQWGQGDTFSEAMEDFGKAIAEDWFLIKKQRLIGPGISKLKRKLQKYIQERERGARNG